MMFVVIIGLVAQLLTGQWWIDGVTSLVIVAFLVKEGREAWMAYCWHGKRHWLGQRQPTALRTYGYGQSVNFCRARQRCPTSVCDGCDRHRGLYSGSLNPSRSKHHGNPGCGIGVIVNTATALAFMRGRTHDIDIASVFTHMAGDAALSLGVLIMAFLIGRTGWLWLDPLVSIAVAIVIFRASWGLMRNAANMAHDAEPPGVDPAAVHLYLSSLPGVTAMHDLHIWAMSTTETPSRPHGSAN